MAEWKKVIVSGSSAVLSGLTLSGPAAAGANEVLVIDSSGVVSSITSGSIQADSTNFLLNNGDDTT